MSDAGSGPASPILPGEEQVQLTSEQQAVADQEKVEEMVHKMMKTRHVDYEKVFGVLESNEDLPNSTVRQGWRVAMPPHQARLPFLHIPQTPWLLVCIALPAGDGFTFDHGTSSPFAFFHHRSILHIQTSLRR